jgi:hypothetical protein
MNCNRYQHTLMLAITYHNMLVIDVNVKSFLSFFSNSYLSLKYFVTKLSAIIKNLRQCII